ncbi:malonic semialdehyde reductase [Dactylosporangium vinaceum]|uniref:Malonic semialdehyde reductase n=1 Tax=Dactylosporangium vinaceum TaxID=53362 RepID=A0ABV5M370_9ACTN|nr:malonic semialdehyde reductase [Dactylosporangium vinaceum]UAB99762.1 malonic semialdehyde reductase [Dactylosporangium vinaceum]
MSAPATHHLLLDRAAQDLLFRAARSSSAFTADPITDEQIEAVYDLIKYAPTSMNQQPLRIVLVRTVAARTRLIRHMLGTNAAKVAEAPLVAILAVDLNFHQKLPRLYPHRPEVAELFADPVVREESGRFNATLQLAYFILGVRAAGLAVRPLAGFDAKAVDRDFFGPPQQRSTAVLTVVTLGRPAGPPRFDRLPRLEFDEVVTTV